MFESIPDAFDSLSRSQYKTDEEFLMAVATENVRRSTPEFKEKYKQAAARLAAQRQAEAVAESQKQWDALKKSVKVPDFEMRRMKDEATQKASADLSDRRISAGDFDATVKKYLDAAVDRYKSSAATNQRLNLTIRGQARK